MTREVFECVKCGVVEPVKVCPNCGIGTVWKRAHASGSVGLRVTLTRLEARYEKTNRWFDFLIILLSVGVPLGGLLIAPILAACLGAVVGLFNWFLAPYAKLRIIQTMERAP